MRLNKYYMPTLKEVPVEAEIPSHQLLLRAAMIRKAASGIYSFLPLGQRVVNKIEALIREEMDRAGSQEVHTSALQPRELWQESGRWKTFGPEMFKVKDRNGHWFCLGPTGEEYFTALVREEVRSYKQLPLNLYQIQWKYRDEKRPRFGINRSREFLMKDAYSFDKDEEGMLQSYQEMWKAYERVFDRLGLDYRVVRGDSGAMGGNQSHEFIALSEVGEGVIAYCDHCDYAATDEKASMAEEAVSKEPLEEVEALETPDSRTIEELTAQLGLPAERMIKAVCLLADKKPVIVFLPAERELNQAKLVSYLGLPEYQLEMMDEETIRQLTGAEAGFTGPVGLDPARVRILVDKTVTLRHNLVCGANQTGRHLKNVNYGRDFQGEVVEDLKMIKEGDRCPHCGSPLRFARGIEVGNIFQLGTKYSDSMGADFLNEEGKATPFVMGSYGIGVTRTVSAVVEQNHDEHGIIWPLVCAPFQAIVTLISVKDEKQRELGESIYRALLDRGVDCLLDDREERAGVKFNDRDLIGIPLRITVGRKAGEGRVEFSSRREMVNTEMTAEEAINQVVSLIESYGHSAIKLTGRD